MAGGWGPSAMHAAVERVAGKIRAKDVPATANLTNVKCTLNSSHATPN